MRLIRMRLTLPAAGVRLRRERFAMEKLIPEIKLNTISYPLQRAWCRVFSLEA